MAEQPVIDTLTLADKLAGGGLDRPVAEGVARVLGEELASRVVTKPDLDLAVAGLHGEVQSVGAKLDQLDAKTGVRFEALESQAGSRFDALEGNVEAINKEIKAINDRFASIDQRFAIMDGEFKSIHAKFWFLYCALSLLLALGLFETFL